MTESPAIISAKSSSSLAEAPIRVLSVDDDSDFLKVTKQILEVHGAFQVDTASSVDEAITKLKKTAYGVIISDYQMPGKDGLQFLKELRDGENDVPVILFTGKGRESVAIQALNLGADGYFNKLDDPETVYGELVHGIRQVVEKNRVEEELRMAGQEKKAILDSMLEQVEYLTPDLRFIWLNWRATELTGMSSEQLVGRHCYEIYHKRDKPCVDCPVKKTLETGLSQEAEIIAPDGRIRFMRNHPVRNLRGDIMGVVAATLDITERKKAENALQESEERYRTLFESSREGIAFSGPQGKISKTNDAFAAMLGYDNPEELVGISAAELNLNPKTRNRKLFQDILEKGYVTRYELMLKKKDGSPIHVLCSGLTRSDEDGNILQTEAFITDITERKKAEKSLVASLAKVQSLNEKLSVIGGLTRHDVNNKLGTIKGNVYLVKQSLAGEHEALKYLREIESAVGEAEQIFNAARVYEKLGTEELSYIRVEDAVEVACKRFLDLKVKVVNDCGGLRVLTDSLLNRLFYNLIDNSLKHGKKVTKIRLYYEDAIENFKLVYEDDGVGIPQSDKEKIFEQDYGKDSGLGLYLIMKMCEVYGWTIKETSKTGKGAQFTIILPKINVNEGKTSDR